MTTFPVLFPAVKYVPHLMQILSDASHTCCYLLPVFKSCSFLNAELSKRTRQLPSHHEDTGLDSLMLEQDQLADSLMQAAGNCTAVQEMAFCADFNRADAANNLSSQAAGDPCISKCCLCGCLFTSCSCVQAP